MRANDINFFVCFAAVYGGSMIGNHGFEVILDGYVKGIVSTDLAAIAYRAMKEQVCIIIITVHCTAMFLITILVILFHNLGYPDEYFPRCSSLSEGLLIPGVLSDGECWKFRQLNTGICVR